VLTGLAHVPSVVVGPGSIDQAHAPVEWVEVHEIEAAVSLYTSIARRMVKPEIEEDTP
jgi:acetylornithine deacetylase/succinyl-diaminopimelate desuccinylase-like protein